MRLHATIHHPAGPGWGVHRAGGGSGFCRMQQGAARLLQRAKGGICACGSSIMKEWRVLREAGGGAFRVCVCPSLVRPWWKFLVGFVQPQTGDSGAAEGGEAGAEEPCSGQRPDWWPEQEEGKKEQLEADRQWEDGVCRATFWGRSVWDG